MRSRNMPTRAAAAAAVLCLAAAGCGSGAEPAAEQTGRRAAGSATTTDDRTGGDPPAVTQTPVTVPVPGVDSPDPAPDAGAVTPSALTGEAPDLGDTEPGEEPGPAPQGPIIEGERRPAADLPETIDASSVTAEAIHCHWDLERLLGHQCFTVEVPRDHSNPDAATTELTVAVQREGDPALPAVAVLADVEGEDTTAVAVARGSAPYRQVFINHRGVGWLNNYDCGAVYDVIGDAAAAGGVAGDELRMQALQGCAAAAADPAGVAAAGISGLAADVAAVMAALDIDRWIVYGGGHGAEVALALLSDPPPGLVGGIIDGVRAAGVYASPSAASAALTEVGGQCRTDPGCAEILAPHGGDLVQLVEDQIERLDAAPTLIVNPDGSTLPYEVEILLDGDTFAAAVMALLQHPARAVALPAIAAGVASGEELYEATAALLATEHEAAEARNLATTARYLMICSQHTDSPPPPAGSRFEAALVPPSLSELCEPWQRRFGPGTSTRSSRAAVRLPVLMLVGRVDPYTHPSDTKKLAAELPAVTVAEFGHLAHPVWVSVDSCASGIIEQFIATLNTGIDTSCATNRHLTGWRTF